MFSALISEVFLATGKLVLKIVYGKHYKEKTSSSENGMIRITGLLFILNVLWLWCLATVFSGKNENMLVYIILSIAYPALIALFAVITRKKYKFKTDLDDASRETKTEVKDEQKTDDMEPLEAESVSALEVTEEKASFDDIVKQPVLFDRVSVDPEKQKPIARIIDYYPMAFVTDPTDNSIHYVPVRRCHTCGVKLNEGAVFCHKCGTKVD